MSFQLREAISTLRNKLGAIRTADLQAAEMSFSEVRAQHDAAAELVSSLAEMEAKNNPTFAPERLWDANQELSTQQPKLADAYRTLQEAYAPIREIQSDVQTLTQRLPLDRRWRELKATIDAIDLNPNLWANPENTPAVSLDIRLVQMEELAVYEGRPASEREG